MNVHCTAVCNSLPFSADMLIIMLHNFKTPSQPFTTYLEKMYLKMESDCAKIIRLVETGVHLVKDRILLFAGLLGK